MIATEAAGRVLEVAEARIIEADTELHEQRCEAERRRRYVGLGRTDELGLRTLIARLEAGDAVAVDAIVHRVAEIIAPRHPEAFPEELRALAFGWLARPAELFTLLLEHTELLEPEAEPAPDLVLDLELDLDEAEQPAPARALAFPADLLDALREVDLSPLGTAGRAARPPARGRAPCRRRRGQGRGLRSGHLDPSHRAPARHELKVQPVKDLSDRVRHTAYEHPESLRDQVHLVTGGDYWPFATSTSRTSTSTTRRPTTTATATATTAEIPRRTRPAPTTPAPSADATTAGRPTRATRHASAAKVATSGSPPTASASSSTTPAPTASTPRRPG